ncbi:hypothetical protein DSO57_1024691 [Entomophthora muscae]|uniref:Uncharacterized protein n=1 Tax=Entomophthora muscae TaxID=34485 RepID=A0ACC2TPZ9_9FUNG|nr:hypothetical protein DSO57_1024691 [Entomophthora muscae]
MATSVSTIQLHPNTPGVSHHKGYTIILPAFKEHKNNINFDDVNDEHTSPHQPEKISVETKIKNRPSDSGSRSRTSEKHQPQEQKSKEASLKRPVGCRKSKEKHQEFSDAIKSRPRASSSRDRPSGIDQSQEYKPQKARLERLVESGKETDKYQEFSSAVEPKAPDRDQKPAKSRPRTVNLQPEPLENVSQESQSKDFQLSDSKPLPKKFLHNFSVLLSGKIFEGDGDSVHTANYLKILPILPNFDFQVNQERLKREFLENGAHDCTKPRRTYQKSPKFHKPKPATSKKCYVLEPDVLKSSNTTSGTPYTGSNSQKHHNSCFLRAYILIISQHKICLSIFLDDSKCNHVEPAVASYKKIQPQF